MEQSLSVFESGNLQIGDRLDMALESQVLPEIQDALKDDEIRQQQINKDLEALIEIPDDSDDSIESDDDALSNGSNQSSEENFQTQEFCENNGAENSYAGENGYSRSHESSCMYNRHYSQSTAESRSSSRATYEDDNSKGDQVSVSRSWGVNGHLENGSLSGGNYPHDLMQHTSPESSRELKMKYRELEILYNEACANLQMLKEAECIYKENTEQEIRIFKQNTALLDEKLRRYNSNLQKANDLISEHKNEKNKLSGRISLLESELTLANQAKEEAMGKLSGSKALIQSLENKVSDLNRFDNISQVRKNHDKMIEEMKSCHHKEMSKKMKEIDELKEHLESKDQTVQDLRQKNKESEDEIERLLLEKNKLLRELAESQRHCQAYFKSGSLEEVSSLKLEIHHLKEEKQYIELKNIELSNDLKSLKAELEAIETQEKLCSIHEHSKQLINEKGKIDLVSELKKSIENTKALRSENKSLKNRLQMNEKKYTELQEMIKVRESHLTDSEEKIKELEAEICKLQSISTGKTSDSNKIKDLEYKLNDMKTKLYDVKDKLKKSCQHGDILAESNRKLEERISSLIQEHLSEKKNAVEECRVKCLAIHNAELQKISEKRDAEIKDLCLKYDTEISLKEKELKTLEDEIHDSKKQYVRLFEEKRSIQLRLDSLSMPKEREEIENELKTDYEKKLNIMKEDLYKEVNEFVENTKQALDAKFQSCLQEEQLSFQKKLDSVKSELHEKYQERIDNLRGRFQSENDALKTQCEQLQSKFQNEFIQLKAVHENETKLKEFEFQKKLQNVQNEMQSFKENMALRLQEGEEINVLKHDFMCQKEKWECERSEFNKKEQNWTEQLKLNAEKEVKFESKIKKYKCYITSQESKQKEKINQLQCQISDLEKNYDAQRNELVLLKREYKLKDVFKKSNKCNSWCQTEETFVSEQKYLKMESKFFECLENITVSIKNYAAESKKRYEDSLEEALMNYHNQMSQRMLQGVSRDIHTFTPTILLPQTQVKSVSDSTFPCRVMPHNGFKTISPPPAEKFYPQTTSYQPIPDTKYSSGSSMLKHSEESCAGKYSSFKPSSIKTSTPAVDGWCADVQKHAVNRNSFDVDHPADINSKNCEINLEDFSYDFLPMGLFEHKNTVREYPEKL